MEAFINIAILTTIEELDNVIQSNQTVIFTVLGDKNERYKFMQKTQVKFGNIMLKKFVLNYSAGIFSKGTVVGV